MDKATQQNAAMVEETTAATQSPVARNRDTGRDGCPFQGSGRSGRRISGSTAHNETLKDELAGYKPAKVTIQFALSKPLPDDLVRSIVRQRIAENRDLAASRKKSRPKT